jgi:EAL domain-containing protein (putative c-di-GMP-specific phosphodiesterase class I)
MGGDEFGIILPSTSREEASAIAENVRLAVRNFRLLLAGEVVGTTTSIGLCIFPEHGESVEEVLSNVDLAVYRAKLTRDRVCVYSPELDSRQFLRSQRLWEQKLRDALDNGSLTLYAQPIECLRSGTRHYELLLRLVDGDRIIGPSDFLPQAERTGLIHEIDRWVIGNAVELLRAHEDEDLIFTINLSSRAFVDDELLPFIQDRLNQAEVNPRRLVFEVSESSVLGNLESAQHFIRSLQDAGCAFAIDDFGAGFSSFTNLKQLPVEYLKIDGSLVLNMTKDPVDQRLVKAIVDVARELGMKTIAEFVADEETVRLLRSLGVDYGQGLRFGLPRPVPAAIATNEASLQDLLAAAG